MDIHSFFFGYPWASKFYGYLFITMDISGNPWISKDPRAGWLFWKSGNGFVILELQCSQIAGYI